MKKSIAAAMSLIFLSQTAQAAVIENFNIKKGRWVIEGTANEDANGVIMSVSSEDSDDLADIREKRINNTDFSFDLPVISANGFYTIKVRDEKDEKPYERKVYLTNNRQSGVMYNSEDDEKYDYWRVYGSGTGRFSSSTGKYNLKSANGETYTYLDGFFTAMDYSFSLDISAVTSGMNEKILFRYTDENNYCYLNIPINSANGEFETGYVKDGKKTVTWLEKIKEDEAKTSAEYKVRIECLGYEARAYVGERLVGNLYSEDLDRGTIGVGGENGTLNFRNVYVKNLIDDVRVGRIEFLSGSGDEIYNIPEDGKITVKAKAENISEEESSKVCLTAAVYENNRLVRVENDNTDILPGEQRDYTVNLENIEVNQTVKAFLWDDYISMKPLNFSKDIKNQTLQENIWVDAEFEGVSDGSAEAPFKTIVEAMNKLKEIRSQYGLGDNGIRITLMGGEYEAESALSFSGKEMSGTLLQPIVISAYPGEEVKIKGSKKADISLASVSEDERIPESAKGKVLEIPLGFDTAPVELFSYANPATKYTGVIYNGAAQTLAKYPNSGYLTTAEVYDKDGESIAIGDTERWSEIKNNENYVWLNVKGADVSKWSTAGNAYLEGYWYKYWTYENAKLLEVDQDNSRVKMSLPNVAKVDADKYFTVYNLLEELDSPGEWYIDNDKKTLYIYPTEEIGENSEVEVTTLSAPIIQISNATDIVFDSVSVENGSQNGIRISSSDRIGINNCKVKNVGASGIYVNGSNDVYISGCDIGNTGSEGIKMESCGKRATLIRSNNKIKNCDIHDFGTVSRSYTAGVRIVGGIGIDVFNNEIHGGTHSGIVFGGCEIRMYYNEIYDCLQMGADSGAIYSGRSYVDWGNEIKYNYLHDIYDNTNIKEPVVGIFMDDMGSGMTIESNIFYKVNSGIFISGGRDTTIRNNIIAEKTAEDYSPSKDGLYAIMLRTSGLMSWHADAMMPSMLAAIDNLDLECEAWQKYPYVNVYPKDYPGAPVRNVVENNVIWNHHPIKKYSDWEKWSPIGENLENSTDPGFVNETAGDLNLKSDSEVFKELSGFSAIPFDKIGRNKQ